MKNSEPEIIEIKKTSRSFEKKCVKKRIKKTKIKWENDISKRLFKEKTHAR